MARIRAAVTAISAATLVACGGGGSDSATPAAVSPAPTGTNSTVAVQLASLDLKMSDTLVKTAPRTDTVVSAVGSFLFNMFPSAMAAFGDSLNVGYNTGFTSKLNNGVLHSLKPKLVITHGGKTDCDLENDLALDRRSP